MATAESPRGTRTSRRWRTSTTITTTLLGLAAVAVALAGVRAYHTLPALAGRSDSKALPPGDTRLGRGVASLVAAHAGTAGIHLLPDPRDAFAARMLLAEAAETSLDIQYYIWRGDLTGTLLFEALHAAADRGVRVRLLLDDNNTSGLDTQIAALDAHPNIEVRLFNPFVMRRARALGFLTDFSRLNRRMHNKSFTADNHVTVIGGRNIGDEYFGAAPEGSLVFADLDVLAVGPVVQDVSTEFDRYWASGSAYPAERIVPAVAPGMLDQLQTAAARIEHDPRAAAYEKAIRESPIVRQVLDRTLPFEWAPTRMVSDDPAKGLGAAPSKALLPKQLRAVIGDPVESLDVVSPYFVPTAAGVESFVAMAQRGVRVRILVNSLAATDVDAVHSGYAKRRKALLEGGISLYEMALTSAKNDGRSAGPFGSSASSLHAKTFSVDGARVFVGSFNFDPRSMNLNTELGFVIESAPLASRIADTLGKSVAATAYQVHLTDDGNLYWTRLVDGQLARYDVEPGTSVWQRAAVWLMSLLPLEPLL
jgi:putative cardiolipin synthase